MRKSILSAVAVLSLCLGMSPATPALTRVAARQSGPTVKIKVDQDLIEEVQEALLALGYDVGRADGDFGTKTKQALRKLQKARGLSVTGRIDRATLAHLRSLIRAVQRALRRRGYDVSVIDGTFGPSTKRALRNFQKSSTAPSHRSIRQKIADSIAHRPKKSRWDEKGTDAGQRTPKEIPVSILPAYASS